VLCKGTSTSTSTLVIRKGSCDSSHECIILDVIHHVLIKNICTCVQFKNIRKILLASVDYEAGLECLIVINS
jgi:hypothetical protein